MGSGKTPGVKDSQKPRPNNPGSITNVQGQAVTGKDGAAIQLSAQSSPLPAPEALKQYNEVLAGSAERWFGLWERQESHRQSCERIEMEALTYSTKTDRYRSLWGIGTAGFLGVAIVASVSYTAAHGAHGVATVIGVGGSGIIIAALGLARSMLRGNQENKTKP